MSDLGAIQRAIRAMFSDVERDREDLHPYQRDIAIPFLMENPFSALFIDMGMGKTVSALTVIADLLAEFDDDDKVLIIGPMRVACETWPTEIRLWHHTAHLDFSLIHIADDDLRLMGVPQSGIAIEKERLRKLAAFSNKTIHIVPYHYVEWLVELWGHKWPYRKVFVDESSGLKDHNSNRFQALKKIRNTDGLITRLHEFTATPAAESYIGLFSQIYLLDKGKRLGNMITHYRNKYFTFNQWKKKYDIRPGAEEEILDKIKDICLVMKADDYLPIGKPNIMFRPVHLGPKETQLYKTLEEEFIVTLDDGTEIEAKTASALSQKLLQLSSGVLYEEVVTVNPDGETLRKRNKVHHIHDKKIEEIQQLVEELQGAPILIGYHWKSSLDRLQKVFPKAVVMDKEGKCVKDWNKGKIPVLLMHPQSGGHGLNLQEGGHHMAFFDIPWSLELYLQFVGRLARQGQKHAVQVWLMACFGTADLGVASSLLKKEDAQEKFFSMLKRRIAKYRKQRELEAAQQLVTEDEL